MVMLSYSDPETKAELEARKRIRDQDWLRGVLGDAAYVTSLTIYGWSKQDAESELRELRSMQRNKWRS